MDQVSHSGLLEDSRFKEVPTLKKKQVPHQLHWFIDEDYFSEELVGFSVSEVESLRKLTTEAFDIFQRATTKILADKQLHTLGIPKFFEPCIYHSWERRQKHPFFAGRFDINGGIERSKGSIIEFNADTFSTLPETVYWQPIQGQELKGRYAQLNDLEKDLSAMLRQIAAELNNQNPVILGSSFGYKEDVLNTNCILDIAHRVGYQTAYLDLEHVIFSEEGIFQEIDEEYIKADVWYKMIPWDWMFNEEPELAKNMAQIITDDLAVVLNPAYTTIWQNKLFLAYITKNFPNDVIAETYADTSWEMTAYAKKPIYGRIGENITIKDEVGREEKTKGDYGDQKVIYQKYYPLSKDKENYYYQIGMFYTHKPSALNLRAQNSKIMTDDCEFMSHYIQAEF